MMTRSDLYALKAKRLRKEIGVVQSFHFGAFHAWMNDHGRVVTNGQPLKSTAVAGYIAWLQHAFVESVFEGNGGPPEGDHAPAVVAEGDRR